MNVKDYIESGIIESYVLGMLSEAEAAEVEQKAQEHPAVRQAIKEQKNTMGNFSQAYAVAPPAHLRSKILAAATGKEEAKVKTEKSPSKKQPWAIAATVLLLISAGFNFVQYQRAEEIKENLMLTEFRLVEMENQQQVMAVKLENIQEDYYALRDTATTRFIMKSVPGRENNLRADIYWNASSEIVYLDVKYLPDAPTGKDYQLWALKDGKPIDMGVFKSELNLDELFEVGRVDGADAFAVTLEPEGGSENPTLEEMYVYGEPVKA